MWRAATAADDEAIVRMGLALYVEDPTGQPVDADRIRRTLAALRREPTRGRAVVLKVDGSAVGYALLISFWSNEYGGEICNLDEVWIAPEQRGRGHTTRLVETVASGAGPWPAVPVAIELEVTAENHRARSLYSRLGFVAGNSTMRRVVRGG